MSHYARQSPRGFTNETVVHRFATRRERDAWVDAHCDDGDCNSAVCGASACTAAEARRILRRRGDAATRSYNSLCDHVHGREQPCDVA